VLRSSRLADFCSRSFPRAGERASFADVFNDTERVDLHAMTYFWFPIQFRPGFEPNKWSWGFILVLYECSVFVDAAETLPARFCRRLAVGTRGRGWKFARKLSTPTKVYLYVRARSSNIPNQSRPEVGRKSIIYNMTVPRLRTRSETPRMPYPVPA
jgi:hypothetical protein